MKTVTITTYDFAELPQAAQERAIASLYDINTDYDWHQCVYDDAADIGLKITSPDKAYFITTATDCANAILAEHGTLCETYLDAMNYLRDGTSDERFLQMLLADYACMLEKEHEYRTSREAIIASIEANDYQFTLDGVIA
jgi:hypothetical protein